MADLFSKKYLSITIAALVIGVTVMGLLKIVNPKEPDWVTTNVVRGNVAEIVSVSGFIEAKNTADLAFPATGIVTEVFVTEGDVVQTGQVVATQAATQLVAQRNQALAVLQGATAQYSEIVSGPSTEERTVTAQNILNAEQNLARVKVVEEEKVANALKTLLSSSLAATSENPNETATPPIISGTYTCAEKGDYLLAVYNSGAYSGYSYQLTGLEFDSGPVTSNQESALGNCGLYIQFDSNAQYGNSDWKISIPNTLSSVYITNKNVYDLSLKTESNNIMAAEDALQLARTEANVANAVPRTETVSQSQANIRQAQAKIAAVDAQISDRSIVAPFNGIITDVSVLPGETATNIPVITILAEDAFELKARIPEIDIIKIQREQRVSIIFDAQPSEVLTGNVFYISPLATEIDGVAYFQTTITLENKPDWIRSGLNADVDIIVQEKENSLILPKRFLVRDTNDSYSVLLPSGRRTITKSIEIPFIGNDGYAEVIGLNEGDTVVAP